MAVVRRLGWSIGTLSLATSIGESAYLTHSTGIFEPNDIHAM